MGESRCELFILARPSNTSEKILLMQLFSLSRQELLAWLNNLLQLNVTKVEQCGTGYGQCFFPAPSVKKKMSTSLHLRGLIAHGFY